MINERFLSDSEIIEVVKEYLNSNIYNYAVMIDGEWGSGKTYFIKNILMEKIEQDTISNSSNNEKIKRIIYISLYGVNSTDDISNSIYLSIINESVDSNEKSKKARSFVNENRVARVISRIGIDFLKNKGVDYKQCLDIIGEAFYINNYVFVFDDLERCNCDINEVLGYINNLVEHDGIKVILVANESEIGKYNESQNIELKYLLASNNNIKYDETSKLNEDKNNKEISVKELKTRTDLIFNQNILYNKIKEKLVGVTIKYKPDLFQIQNELIDKHIKDPSLKEYLKKNLEESIGYALQNNHINLRTYQFFLSKLCRLNEYIKENYADNYKEIMDELVNYCYKVSVMYKSGKYQYQWEGEQLYGHISFKYAQYITGFRFVDDYLVYSKFDNNQINTTLDLYLDEKEKMKNNPDDPLRKYECWWEIDEVDLREGIKEIKNKLESGGYGINDFPKLIKYFINLDEIGFEKEILQSVVRSMYKIIDEQSDYVEIKDYIALESISDESIKEKYTSIINPMKERMKEKRKSINNDNLKYCLENIDEWGERLYYYVTDDSNKQLNQKAFFRQVNLEKLKENIKESNCENLSFFRYTIYEMYKYFNGEEECKSDSDSIMELIEYVNEIISSNLNNLTKKKNLEMLLELLQEKYDMLIKQ